MIRSIADTYKTSFSGLTRETWLLSVVILINRCGYMVLPFMSMYITQSLHRSIADAGLIITLFGIGSVTGTTTSGYLTDRIGFRAVQVVSAMLGGCLFLLFAQIQHFQTLCVLTVLLGFIVEAFRPANFAAVATYAGPQTLTRSISLNRLAINLGWGLGSSLGGILAAINYHILFRVEGSVNILVGLLILLLLPATPRQQRQEQPIPGETTTGKDASPWKDPFAFRFFLLSTLYTTCFVLLFRLVPVYWKEAKHIGESHIGLLLGLNGIIIALFEMVLVRRWENGKAPSWYVIAGVIATAAGYSFLLAPGLPALLMALGTVVLITIGEMMAVPFMNTLFMSRATARNRGKYSAAYALCWSIANIAGPLGGASLAQRFGYNLLWIVLILLCLGCAYAFKLVFATGNESANAVVAGSK